MVKLSNQPISLGVGVLNWAKIERVSDRYGIVFLAPESGGYWAGGPEPEKEVPMQGEYVGVRVQHAGEVGKLVAIVKETRKSGHIGDLFHGIGPRTPKVGQRIVLGEGQLVFEEVEGVRWQGVGVHPPVDGREHRPWMKMRALYDCHDQTVELVFIPN